MRVKKVTSLLLAILILVSNVGLAFNVHFCGDKIASVSSLFVGENNIKDNTSKKECCCKEDDGKKDSCCRDKVVDLKKDTKDLIFKTFSFQTDAPFILIKLSELVFAKADKIISKTNVTEYYCSPNAPPLFKLYQQYIFYA